MQQAAAGEGTHDMEDAHIRRRYLTAKISIGIILLGIISFLYLLFWPFKVTELGNISISTNPVTAGQYQRYTAEICNNPGVVADVERSMVFKGTDEAPVSSPASQAREVLCSNIVLVPSTLPNADYEIVLHFTYHTNPIRDALNPIERTFRSKPFTVQGGRDIPLPTNLPDSEEPPDNVDRQTSQNGPNTNTPPDGSVTNPPNQGTAPTSSAPFTNGGNGNMNPQQPATGGNTTPMPQRDPLLELNLPGVTDITIDRPPLLDVILSPLNQNKAPEPEPLLEIELLPNGQSDDSSATIGTEKKED